MEHLLEVKNLSVSIDGPAGEVQAVRDVSFSLKKGEVLAIVGESGCGKSVLCKSIMKLLPPSAKIKRGKHLCERTGYHLLQGKGDAETAWKSFFYDLSGSYDIPESNY